MKKHIIKTDKFYSTNEIATILGVSHQAVYKKIKLNRLSARKIAGNFVVLGEDLANYLYPSELTESKKRIIEGVVSKVVDEYGEALRKLGKE
jgi:predicted DNA-binding protein YlxM (UPF0122 family)